MVLNPAAGTSLGLVARRRQGGGCTGPIANGARIAAYTHPGSTNLTKSKIDLDRIVQELMDGELSKAQRIKRLRELATSGDEVPEELMDEALRKLMERITE